MKKLSVLLALVCAGLAIAQAPVNDICQSSVLLPGPGIYAGTNVNATASLFGTGTCGTTGYDVWYRYTANGTGNKLIASTCFPGNSSFNSGVDLYTGTCLGPPATAGCNVTYCDQGSPSPTGGRAQTTTTAGVTYLIRVKGIGNGVTGLFNLYVDELTPTPQPNGSCGGSITVTNGINTGFSNFGEPAALATGFTSTCTAAGKDVFFAYTATATGNTTARTCFQTIGAVPALHVRDTVVSVYTNCAGGSPIACNDDGCSGTPGSGSKLSTVQFPSTQGQLYIIQVAGAGTGTSAAEGNFDLEIVPPLVNDECAGATPVVSGSNGPFSNQLATNSAGYSGSCATGFQDLFYVYTPTCGSPTTISTGCGGFDSVLQVYSACGGSELVCNDNDPSGTCFLNSVVTLNTTAGTPYLIRVSSWGSGQFGTYTVDITPGFGLNWSSPSGSGTVQFSMCNGPPNGQYYMFVSLVAGGFPNGWFYGIDITLGDIANQIGFGFPFNGVFNGSGSFTSPIFGGVPSGLPVYSVAFALPPGASAPSANSGAKSYIIP